ncbi:MAG TPA: hypothetical protein PKN13_10035 [Accumulibacter sp.]|nr:hypothetical protein [Accumulibacter sp.]HMW17687.1 hypothetical protein [Accumulibacter sp.]HNC18860.1 hypothetical protein [Accumulibacter sp.]HND80431.1 hypothetical protein [Accumulibacter sp.]HNE14023.1 hypothetical protein [Accumulibacter sp.]
MTPRLQRGERGARRVASPGKSTPDASRALIGLLGGNVPPSNASTRHGHGFGEQGSGWTKVPHRPRAASLVSTPDDRFVCRRIRRDTSLRR